VSLSTILFGKKPTLRAAGADEMNLTSQGYKLYNSSARTGLTSLGYQGIADLAGGMRGQRIQQMGAGATDVNAQFAGAGAPVSNGDALNRALLRAKGLSRIARATSDQFDNTLLRQRIGAVTGGYQRMNAGISGLGQVAYNQERLARGQTALSDQAAGQRSNIYGTAIGAGLRIGLGQLANRSKPDPNANLYGAVGYTPDQTADWASEGSEYVESPYGR
jgi:hypothetical protein